VSPQPTRKPDDERHPTRTNRRQEPEPEPEPEYSEPEQAEMSENPFIDITNSLIVLNERVHRLSQEHGVIMDLTNNILRDTAVLRDRVGASDTKLGVKAAPKHQDHNPMMPNIVINQAQGESKSAEDKSSSGGEKTQLDKVERIIKWCIGLILAIAVLVAVVHYLKTPVEVQHGDTSVSVGEGKQPPAKTPKAPKTEPAPDAE
jgi:hypothetical protein